MSWWLIPVIVGVFLISILVGLLIGYIILKIQKRPWPFSRKFESITIDRGITSISAPTASQTIVPSATRKSAALVELENNLEIASRPPTNGLEKFQTDIWNNRRSEFDPGDAAILGELTEAYVDMALANNIVWITNELGQNRQDLTNDYTKLSAKVAQRLNRIMPDVREKLQ